MNYSNGRVAQVGDRVLVASAQGMYIGNVSEFEGAHLRVHPMFMTAANYVDPADALLVTDALRTPDQVPKFGEAPAPVTPTVPAPAAPAATAPSPAAPVSAPAKS